MFAVKEKNFNRALDVLASYEEEELVPSPRTLRYLGKVLQSNDIPVPFIVPEVPERVSID